MADDLVICPPAPEDTGLAGATLSVDLKVLQDNWRMLARRAGGAECAATVKANGYGLGIQPVARALAAAGCKSFFVALPQEGIALRAILPDAVIYVLDGLMPGMAEVYVQHKMRPVLASLEAIGEWTAHCARDDTRYPAGLHVDTGINRLGLSATDVLALANEPERLDGFEISLIMSHLACGDTPGHEMNREQLDRFNDLRAMLPPAPASIANSPGTFIAPDFALDIVRPGIALFGGNPFTDRPNPMSAVAHIYAPILQVRHLSPGEATGYGQAWRAERPSRIAVLGVGYGDGYPRKLCGPGGTGPAQVLIGGHFAPVVGRVSMDMITVDVTDTPDEFVRPGVRAEVMGDNISVDEVARWAETIPYEILTGLGMRFARLYSLVDSG